MNKIICLIFLSLIFFSSCNENTESVGSGQLALDIRFLVDGSPVEFNRMKYSNAAGNLYEITNVQFFISDIALIDTTGKIVPLLSPAWLHYIDSDIPETQTITFDGVKTGSYKGLMFVFGIKGEKNIPGMLTNPPESNMIWPYNLGGDFGGYHYMKLNGFWTDTLGLRNPFNIHLGVGQIYNSNMQVTGFIQNWFEVFLPNSSITLTSNDTKYGIINMNIESWFKSPHIYDINQYGGMIMMNQEAMGKIRDNGSDVFNVEFKLMM
jgi:hypothetical protein